MMPRPPEAFVAAWSHFTAASFDTGVLNGYSKITLLEKVHTMTKATQTLRLLVGGGLCLVATLAAAGPLAQGQAVNATRYPECSDVTPGNASAGPAGAGREEERMRPSGRE